MADKPKFKVERNLTTKTLGIEPAKLMEEAVKALGKDPTKEQLEGLRVPAGVMFGIITQVKPQIDSKSGEIRAVLVGQFEGRNADGGLPVRSARCYVPMVQETIEGEFNALPANVRGQRMKFQANLYLVHSDNEKYPYNWSIDLPLKDTESDPLSDMRGDLADL